jgi:hypothetical protein
MPKARTTIQFGQEDGSVKTISAGEDVSGVDDDTMQQLIDAGAVEDPNAQPEDHGQVVGEMPKEDDKTAQKPAVEQPSSATAEPTTKTTTTKAT